MSQTGTTRSFTKRLKGLDGRLSARVDDRRQTVVVERHCEDGRTRKVLDVRDPDKGTACAPNGSHLNRLRAHDTRNHDVLADIERSEELAERSADNSVYDVASSLARDARPLVAGRVAVRVGIEWDPRTGKVLEG